MSTKTIVLPQWVKCNVVPINLVSSTSYVCRVPLYVCLDDCQCSVHLFALKHKRSTFPMVVPCAGYVSRRGWKDNAAGLFVTALKRFEGGEDLTEPPPGVKVPEAWHVQACAFWLDFLPVVHVLCQHSVAVSLTVAD